jgi:GNAT superfamily N-acetyltransferase
MTDQIRFAIDTATAEEIARHLVRCDAGFVPHLSDRVDITEYASKLHQHAVRFEAWHGEGLIGLVAAYLNNEALRVAWITNVSVDPRHQRTGVASRLLTRCARRARALGFESIELEVDGANEAAINLYGRAGFNVSARRGDLIVMELVSAGSRA